MVEAERTASGLFRAGPLADIRVLDLTRVLAGPLGTLLLGDLGADIIKVETPGVGDDVRTIPPFKGGMSHYFLAVNRNKRSIVVDLKTAAGRAVLLDLVEHCDVVVENFRPGVLDKLGLGYEELAKRRPDIIVCSISGFGQTGPLRDRPSFDLVTQALTGVMSVTGEPGRPPVKMGLPTGDQSGGLFGAIAILAALNERRATGKGQRIDLSLYDCLLSLLGYLAEIYFFTGESLGPVGSGHHSVVPYGAFECQDGRYVILALHASVFYRKFCTLVGRPDLITDPRFHNTTERRTNKDELAAIVANIMRQKPLAEWLEVLTEGDIPSAPVNNIAEALEHPHTLARGMVQTMDDPRAGPVKVLGRPIKFPLHEDTPLRPPPDLGEHTADVLSELLGYSAERIEALRDAGAIQVNAHSGADA
jgi:crotonobetainyl-CoA:carnitine CoA-transferase CaiB-like acyl-CoA transferase